MKGSTDLTNGTPPEFDAEPDLGRIVFHSLCSAACAVVPVPFLDDHLVKLTRRRMVREMTTKCGLTKLEANDLAILSGTTPKPLGIGCMVGVLFSMISKIVFKVLRRISRTILFWLLIKDAADAASKTFHEGYLISGTLSRKPEPWLPPPEAPQPQPFTLPANAASLLRTPVDGVLEKVNTRALNHAFRGVLGGSRRLLVGIARALSKLRGLRSEADDGEEVLEQELTAAIPRSLVDRVAKSLRQDSDYLRSLDELLAEQFFLDNVPEKPAGDTPSEIRTWVKPQPRPPEP